MKTTNYPAFLIGILFICSLITPIQADSPAFSEGLYRWQHSGKLGFIDTSGKPAIPFIWDDVWAFRNGIAPVKKNGKWGMINQRCELVVPLIWDEIRGAGVVGDDTSNGLFKVSKGEKFGLIDKHGKVVAEPIWDEIRGFQGGVSPVRKGGKSIQEISKLGNARTVEDYGKWGFIDAAGRVVEEPGRWRAVHNFIDGRFQVVESGGTVRRPVYKNVKYEDGLMVIDEAYEEERRKQAQVVKMETEKLKNMGFDIESFNDFYRYKQEGKVGLVNSEGKISSQSQALKQAFVLP